MKLNLPSPKASGLILLIVVFSTAIVVYSNYDRQSQEQTGEITTNKIAIDSQINKENLDIDTDGDGLLDWEESLWGTDPNNPDTDGDGTNDYQEINENRDPLIPGPNDETTSIEEKILEQMQSSELDEDGITSQVANNFANLYFNNRQGTDLTQEQRNLLVNQVSNQAISEIKINEIYTLNSIKTFNKEDEEKLIEYTDSYFAIQLNILNEVLRNYENTDYSRLGNEIIKKSGELISIEVPSDISNLHLEIANNYYKLGMVVKDFEKEEEDPIYVMLSLRIYQDTQEEIKDINNQIGNFLKENGIIIEENGIEIRNDQ